MDLLRLAEGVWAVLPAAPPRFPYGVCLYLEDDRSAVIDLGAGGPAFAALPGERVELGLISHFHFDHVHGDRFFPRAALHAGRQEAAVYCDRDKYQRCFGFDRWTELMAGVRWVSFAEATGRPLPPDVLVGPGFRNIPLAGTFGDGEVFELGRRRVRAVHLPGHTAGHYGFFLEEEGILFAGDIDPAAAGPWYFGESSDVTDFIASLERIGELRPRMLVTSHSQPLSEGIVEGLERLRQVLLRREEELREMLRQPQTLEELAQRRLIFPRPKHIYELFWEKMGLRNHLRRLEQLGLVKEDGEGVFSRA